MKKTQKRMSSLMNRVEDHVRSDSSEYSYSWTSSESVVSMIPAVPPPLEEMDPKGATVHSGDVATTPEMMPDVGSTSEHCGDDGDEAHSAGACAFMFPGETPCWWCCGLCVT